MRVTIYARVSTKRDAQKNSLNNQISCATNRATLSGWLTPIIEATAVMDDKIKS